MNQLLILAILIALGAAKHEDMKADAAASPITIHDDDDRDKDHHGPQVLSVIDARKGVDRIYDRSDIEKQNEIIRFTYSPVYYEPTWILDYRFLKSGGRDYVRGPGGQILILPKNVRAKDQGYQDEHHDYDSLIEYLRIKELSEEHREPNFNKRRDHERRPQDLGWLDDGYGQNTHNPYEQRRQYD